MVKTKSAIWKEKFEKDDLSWSDLGEIIVDLLSVYRTRDKKDYVSQNQLWRSINYELGFMARDEEDYPISRRKMREGIRLLRRKGFLIVSTSGKGGGYRLTDDHEDVTKFVDQEYMAKGLDMIQTGSIMLKSSQEKSGKQSFWAWGMSEDLLDLINKVERIRL